MDLLLSVGAAFLAGIFASMGLGGGVVLMIYLRMVSDFSQLTAQGINLAFFLPVGLVAIIIHNKNKLISWKSVLWCVPAGLLGVAIAALIVSYLPEELLGKAFACLLLWIGLREIWAACKKQPQKE